MYFAASVRKITSKFILKGKMKIMEVMGKNRSGFSQTHKIELSNYPFKDRWIFLTWFLAPITK